MSVVSERKNISAEIRAIRLVREQKEISREEMGGLLGVSFKTIESIENGRMSLSRERKEAILEVLGVDDKELKRIKKHWVVKAKEKKKTVLQNTDRRSYRKIITKEVKILIHLRRAKKLTQDKASFKCGYSRPTIGHIENGRIEIPRDRIRHIIHCYGYQFSKFEELMKEEVLRDEILDLCFEKMCQLNESKLKLVQTMLANL